MSRLQIAIKLSSKEPPDYARRRHLWHMFVQEADVWEHRLLRVMQSYFKRVREEVIGRLMTLGPSVEGQYRGWSRRKVVQHISQKSPIDRINIDKAAEKKILYQLFDPLVKVMVERRGGEFINAQIGTTIVFNANDPAVLEFIGSRMEQFSKSVSGTTFDQIKASLRAGFTEGMPLSTIADNLRTTFASFERYRAPLIARTETISALNKTDLMAIQQAGIADRLLKKWLTAGDEEVRESHRKAGNYYATRPIKVDDSFKVGKDQMVAPGLGQRPEENINCRCTVEYIKVPAKVPPGPKPPPPPPRPVARPAPPKPPPGPAVLPTPTPGVTESMQGDAMFRQMYKDTMRTIPEIPKNVKTVDGLKKYMLDNTRGISVDLSGNIEAQVTKDSLNAWIELQNKYPEIGAHFKYIGTLENTDVLRAIGKSDFVGFFKTKYKRAYAMAWWDSLSINPMYWKNGAELKSYIGRDVLTGFHPKSSKLGPAESIIAHEFGHNMSLFWQSPQGTTMGNRRLYQNIWSRPKTAAEKILKKDMQKRLNKLKDVWHEWHIYWSENKSKISSSVARYGAKNADEGFAECWSDWYMRKKAGDSDALISKHSRFAGELSEKAFKLLRGIE